MGSAALDRISGALTATAVKSPCVAVAVINITLAGLQTVNGVAVAQDDRVLVTAQTSAVDNGIYIADSGNWNRAADFDGDRDVVNGTLIVVPSSGGVGLLYQTLSTNPVVPGSSAIHFALRDDPNITYPITTAEQNAGITPSNTSYPPGDVRRQSAVLNGTADDTTPLRNAIAALNGRGSLLPFTGTLKVTGQIVVPTGVLLKGTGFSEKNGTGSGNRGAACILRAFTGSLCTLLFSGDDTGIDGIDIDNNLQGTGECMQVTGSRIEIGAISTRNSGGDGLRIGKTDAGASTANANGWRAGKVITCGNTLAGFRVDDTNTTTSLSYPLGAANANAGTCALVDARNNGTDGLQLGNCNDNVFTMVVSQNNTGCGARFKTDGTNSGPRCNKIVGNDCEANTGNDIQIDAATLPVSGPGLYNVVFGNRSVAVNSRIVDNSTGSLVIQWSNAPAFRNYSFGTDVNAVNLAGNAGFNMAVGANGAPARVYAVSSGAADSILRGQVHKAGGALVDGWELNQNLVFRTYGDLTNTSGATLTPDCTTGLWFDHTTGANATITVNAPTNGITGQIIEITIRNTSGGAVTVNFNAVYKISGALAPANGNSRTILFRSDGTNWIERTRSTADVPN